MSKSYAIIVKNKGRYSSFFGLCKIEKNIIEVVLEKMDIPYDVYLFQYEKRLKKRD